MARKETEEKEEKAMSIDTHSFGGVSQSYVDGQIDKLGTVAYLKGASYDEVIQGTWTLDGNTHYVKNETSNANGDGIRFKAYLTKGTYNLLFFALKTSSAPILSFRIDGDEVASEDMYSSSEVREVIKKTNITVNSSGLKTIDVVCDGKNASSGGYTIYFYWMYWVRVE